MRNFLQDYAREREESFQREVEQSRDRARALIAEFATPQEEAIAKLKEIERTLGADSETYRRAAVALFEALSASWDAERAAEVAEKQVAALPATAAAYRRRALALAGVVRRSTGDICAPRGGYQFGEDTAEAVEDLLDEVIELIERAPIRYSPAARLVDEARVRAEVLGDV